MEEDCTEGSQSELFYTSPWKVFKVFPFAMLKEVDHILFCELTVSVNYMKHETHFFVL